MIVTTKMTIGMQKPVCRYTNYPRHTVIHDTGAGIEVSYVEDTKLYINKKFTELAADIVSGSGGTRKHAFETVINKGGFDLSAMLRKIDSYHISGSLTDAERDALCEEARAAAQPESSVDVSVKLAQLEKRARKLESGTAKYITGKWYYAGDKCLFRGVVYTCTAPAGAACVWSPEEYPACWEAAV